MFDGSAVSSARPPVFKRGLWHETQYLSTSGRTGLAGAAVCDVNAPSETAGVSAAATAAAIPTSNPASELRLICSLAPERAAAAHTNGPSVAGHVLA